MNYGRGPRAPPLKVSIDALFLKDTYEKELLLDFTDIGVFVLEGEGIPINCQNARE